MRSGVTVGVRPWKQGALAEGFGQLAGLQTLKLNSIRRTALPESFGQLAALQSLELDQNQLTTLPESFGKLAALQALSCYCRPLLSRTWMGFWSCGSTRPS